MSTLKTKILTPYGTVYDGDVTGIQMPGRVGSFEVRYNHAPIISILDVGKLTIRETGDSEALYAISGGYVEVNDNVVTVLAESAERKDKIDVQRAEEARKRAEQEIRTKKARDMNAEMALKRAINRIRVSEL
ncbi:MAG: ATP synthase F1 subunit epsilon [Balneolaceae bacterium]|nr:MAG: ATP synthase F1 subunit epsilon [Balneolaceae bacterium]